MAMMWAWLQNASLNVSKDSQKPCAASDVEAESQSEFSLRNVRCDFREDFSEEYSEFHDHNNSYELLDSAIIKISTKICSEFRSVLMNKVAAEFQYLGSSFHRHEELSWCRSALHVTQLILCVICILVAGNISCADPISNDGMYGLEFDILKLLNYRCLEILTQPTRAEVLFEGPEPNDISGNISTLLKRTSCLFCAIILDCSGEHMIAADSIWYYCALTYLSSTDAAQYFEVLLLKRFLDKDCKVYMTYGSNLDDELSHICAADASDTYRKLSDDLIRDYSCKFNYLQDRELKDSFIIANNCFRYI
jgi:hypothetical protein